MQSCVVHLVRNSLRCASKAHWSKITADLKAVYTSSTVLAAEAHFAQFTETWRIKCPAMVAMWERSWAEFIPFLDFPPEIEKLICTKNGVESLNARFRAAARRTVATRQIRTTAGGLPGCSQLKFGGHDDGEVSASWSTRSRRVQPDLLPITAIGRTPHSSPVAARPAPGWATIGDGRALVGQGEG